LNAATTFQEETVRTDMQTVNATWRTAHLTGFDHLETQRLSQEAARTQQNSEALKALKQFLPAQEYETMAAQCRAGERELRLVDGFVMTYFSR
jgi:hypothetical protein